MDEELKNKVIIVVNPVKKRIVTKHIYITGMDDTNSKDDYIRLVLELLLSVEPNNIVILDLSDENYSNITSLELTNELLSYNYCQLLIEELLDDTISIIEKVKNYGK